MSSELLALLALFKPHECKIRSVVPELLSKFAGHNEYILLTKQRTIYILQYAKIYQATRGLPNVNTPY